MWWQRQLVLTESAGALTIVEMWAFGQFRKLAVVVLAAGMLGVGATSLEHHWERQYWRPQRLQRQMLLSWTYPSHPFLVAVLTIVVGCLQGEANADPELRKTFP